MYKTVLSIAFFGLLISCGGSEEVSENEVQEEMDDTVSNTEINPEDLIEDGPNEFNWIENIYDYEGKDPDSDISLAVMISGVRDTLDLFTIWSFPEEVNDRTRSLVGYPENLVAEIASYYDQEFIAIQEQTLEKYSILYVWMSDDTIHIDEPIGSIELKNGLINYSIDFPEDNGMYYKFGERGSWD